ncbi:hypothetical protein HH212_02140 [Massilia forsythiae]|uniref:Cysteine-rich CPCC domain-containing protein n=1 Tax=Massilia forsythiae TaxID=2728020 RepID=A0A7Z2VTT8_9BURK|nr:CPCC family cysteine-rich protein [Massilia forsythiae]QJD98982.1 hypothetical protein HH212_02140 [Massilia forsythiae]
MHTKLRQCECCDYFTLEGHDNELCSVCFWTQSTIRFAEFDEPSRLNFELTLRDGRCNFLRYGACASELASTMLNFANRLRYQQIARRTPMSLTIT